MERSEEQVITQEPVRVTLGGKRVDIKPLTMRKAKAVREKLAPILEKIYGREGALDTKETLKQAISESPDEIAAAVALYMGWDEAQTNEMLDTATELEMGVAFGVVMGLIFFPFQTQAGVMRMSLRPDQLERAAASKDRQPSAPLSTLQ
jgi:hypothetical protein